MKIKKIYKIFKKNETSTTPQQKGEGDRKLELSPQSLRDSSS